jgi:hemoglobin/transferrin/lactoferrin receptor protein
VCPLPGGAILINSTSLAQYQNTGDAQINGVELNADYDAGGWFAGVAGQAMRGRDQAGLPLATIQPDQLATTLGIRSDDRKLTLAMRWTAIAAKSAAEIPDRNKDGVPDFLATGAYNLVGLYLGYSPTQDVTTSFSVDNLFNQYYVPYLQGQTAAAGQPPGVVFPGPGITFKAGLQIRFAAK